MSAVDEYVACFMGESSLIVIIIIRPLIQHIENTSITSFDIMHLHF